VRLGQVRVGIDHVDAFEEIRPGHLGRHRSSPWISEDI